MCSSDLMEGFSWADQVDLAVSFTRSTGVQLLKDPIEERLAQGGKLRILTSTYQHLTEPQALRSLMSLGPGLDCRVQQGADAFHPKFWLFRSDARTEAWVGSSNFTRGGLSTNVEWNLRNVNAQLSPKWAANDLFFDMLIAKTSGSG